MGLNLTKAYASLAVVSKELKLQPIGQIGTFYEYTPLKCNLLGYCQGWRWSAWRGPTTAEYTHSIVVRYRVRTRVHPRLVLKPVAYTLGGVAARGRNYTAIPAIKPRVGARQG